MSIEAMRQALHTLEGWVNVDDWVWPETAKEQAKRNTVESITSLRQAIEQAQKPVAWISHSDNLLSWDKFYDHMEPLYTAPPQRQWVGLTNEEIKECERKSMVNGSLPFEQREFFARAIEAKLKEKNT